MSRGGGATGARGAVQVVAVCSPGIGLAAGERLYSRWKVRASSSRSCWTSPQLDLCHAGGLTECLKIAALADTYPVMLTLHSPKGPVSTVAAAQLALAIPKFLIRECALASVVHKQELRELWPVVEGHLYVQDCPGVGVDLDTDVSATNPP